MVDFSICPRDLLAKLAGLFFSYDQWTNFTIFSCSWLMNFVIFFFSHDWLATWYISVFVPVTYYQNSQIFFFFIWPMDEFHKFFPAADWRILCIFTWSINKFHDIFLRSNNEIYNFIVMIGYKFCNFFSCDNY